MALRTPTLSEHGGELVLIGMIGAGVLILIGMMIVAGWDNRTTPQLLGDVSPFLLIEQSIIGAIKDRWQARLQGQSNQLLGGAVPAAAPSATEAAASTERTAA